MSLLSHTQIFKERLMLTSQRLEINIQLITQEYSVLNSYCVVVEPNGIEPLTSCVQGRRSPS
jgi:hypothetical protein